MAEMWTRSPIMQGNTEQHQLTLISQLCGSITPEVRARAQAGCGGWEERGMKRWCGQGPGLATPGAGCFTFLAPECDCYWHRSWGSSCKCYWPPGSQVHSGMLCFPCCSL